MHDLLHRKEECRKCRTIATVPNQVSNWIYHCSDHRYTQYFSFILQTKHQVFKFESFRDSSKPKPQLVKLNGITIECLPKGSTFVLEMIDYGDTSKDKIPLGSAEIRCNFFLKSYTNTFAVTSKVKSNLMFVQYMVTSSFSAWNYQTENLSFNLFSTPTLWTILLQSLKSANQT
jgi:hypothetical protein